MQTTGSRARIFSPFFKSWLGRETLYEIMNFVLSFYENCITRTRWCILGLERLIGDMFMSRCQKSEYLYIKNSNPFNHLREQVIKIPRIEQEIPGITPKPVNEFKKLIR